jgi:hypothetical protein
MPGWLLGVSFFAVWVSLPALMVGVAFHRHSGGRRKEIVSVVVACVLLVMIVPVAVGQAIVLNHGSSHAAVEQH